MKKIVALCIMLCLLLCASAAADGITGMAMEAEKLLNGVWECLNPLGLDLEIRYFLGGTVSFPDGEIFPPADCEYEIEDLTIGFTVMSDGQAPMLLIQFQKEGDDPQTKAMRLAFSADGNTMTMAEYRDGMDPIVYRRVKEEMEHSPVGEWVAADRGGDIVLTFKENGQLHIDMYGEESFDVWWTLDEDYITVFTNFEGFEECVCPYDDESINIAAMGVNTTAVRR